MTKHTMPDDDNAKDLGPNEFLGYRLLIRLREQGDVQISRSKFLKLSSIAARYLETDLGVDIGFPRYWYKYGEIAAENEINDRFYRSGRSAFFKGRNYTPKKSVDDSGGWEDQMRFGEDATLFQPTDSLEADEFNVDEEVRHEINSAVRWAALKFKHKNVKEIKRYQYQRHAPREFIRAYSDLRFELDQGAQQSQLTGPMSRDRRDAAIEDLLDEMVMTYPEEFDTLHTLYLRWDDTARLILEQDDDYSQLVEFVKSLVETVSKTETRFLHHANIPDARIETWAEKRQTVLEEFEEEIEEERRGRLLRTSQEDEAAFDEISDSFGKTVEDDLDELYNS